MERPVDGQPSPQNAPHSAPPSVHARLGDAPLAAFAVELYARIDADPRIRAMFPEDLGAESPSVRDMREFLIQFFGGPSEYSQRKGHPRLRARHLRFPIGPAARDAWLENALGALEKVSARFAIDAETAAEMRAYFAHASAFMVNRADDVPPAQSGAF